MMMGLKLVRLQGMLMGLVDWRAPPMQKHWPPKTLRMSEVVAAELEGTQTTWTVVGYEGALRVGWMERERLERVACRKPEV